MPLGIQICSGAEWRVTKPLLGVGDAAVGAFPYGEFVETEISGQSIHCSCSARAGASTSSSA